MPIGCFACFGAPKEPEEPVRPAPVREKAPVLTVLEDRRQDESFPNEVQAALSKAPTDSAEARISYIAAQVLHHLRAKVVRLYGWTADDADDPTAGSLVLLTVDWQRQQAVGTTGGASEGNGAYKGSAGGSVGSACPQLPDLPGQRVVVGPPAAKQEDQQGFPVPLLHKAVHTKAPAAFTYPPITPVNGINGAAGHALPPPDCTSDHALLGARDFAALPLTSGDRLLGVLWIGAAATAASDGAAGLPQGHLLRQLCTSVSMCLVGGAVDPEYLAWLTGSLRRLAASTTLQALVGELCDATAQHVRRRFFIDSIAHAAVVPDVRSTVAYILDHRPQLGGPAGVARWAAAAAAAASRQASMTYTGSAATGGAVLPPRSGMGVPSSQSVRRSDSFTSPSPMGPLGGANGTVGTGAGAGGPRTPQRSSSHAAMRISKRQPSLVEQATARASVAANSSPSGPGDLTMSRSSVAQRHSVDAAAAAAAAAAGVLPSLRAKGFQMSHTLLQRMVSAAEGRGPDGVYSGLAVADCGRHVQDVHQPSRDVCMLMAGGVRGADTTTDASDSNMFASERSTGRVSMQSLVLVGIDVGTPGGLLLPSSQGGAGGDGGSAVLAVYLTFPTRLPPLLVSSALGSVRQLLSVMLARLVRCKVHTDLDTEFFTLCTGVPGSYAVVPSTQAPAPVAREAPSLHQAAAAAVGAGLLDASGLAGGTAAAAAAATAALAAARSTPSGMVLEPSIGAPVRASSCKLVPLAGWGAQAANGMSMGASAKLLAAYTDAGCRSMGPQGALPGVLPPAEPSGRAFPQTHDGSARTHGGTAARSVLPERLFTSHLEEEEEEEEDASPTAEEADVMLSSDPRIDEVDSAEGAAGGGGGAPAAARTTTRRRGGGSTHKGVRDEDEDEDELFGEALRPPSVPPQPAAVLTVSEADGTSSMRQHMGLLVESLMSTLRSTAQADDHFDSTIVSARRSMDLELDDLRLSGVLGDGGSGVVLCGMLGTVPVAVKIIQMPEVDQLLHTVKALRGRGGGRSGAAANGVGSSPREQYYANGGAPSSPQQQHQQQQHPQPQQRLAPPPTPAQQHQNGGGGGEGGGGVLDPVAASVSSSKLKQARRDMLRNAMELAVMRSITHVNIATVYAVYDNVILERVKREGGATAYALRRQCPEDMQMDKTDSKPVFVALCMELCDSGSLASKLEERSFPRVLMEEPSPPSAAGAGPGAAAAGGAGGHGGGLEAGRSSARRGARVLDMVGIYLTVLEVACALRYLHARRLLHRDIKSANILLKASPTDPRGWMCKLADFGSALVLDQFQPPEEIPGGAGGGGAGEATGEGAGGGGGGRWYSIQEQSWGTITHMSPESMDNSSRVDASSDIFALGIVMWEIASGRGYRPYKELAPEQIGAAVRKGLRPTFTSEVPMAYRTLAQQCWAAEPHKRPSAVQVVAAVKAQLSQLQAERSARALALSGSSHARHHNQQQQQQQPAALPRS